MSLAQRIFLTEGLRVQLFEVAERYISGAFRVFEFLHCPWSYRRPFSFYFIRGARDGAEHRLYAKCEDNNYAPILKQMDLLDVMDRMDAEERLAVGLLFPVTLRPVALRPS